MMGLMICPTFCSLVYLWIACQTSVFADWDPVSSVRLATGQGYLAGMYITIAVMTTNAVLRLLGLRLVFVSVFMSGVFAMWLVQYVVHQQNAVVAVLNSYLHMVATAFNVKHENWQIPDVSAWDFLWRVVDFSNILLKCLLWAIKFDPFSSPLSSNVCFVFGTVLCASYLAELRQERRRPHALTTHKE